VTAVISIALALVGRLAAVVVPITLLRPFRVFAPGVTPIMTWGGLKGGISVALALSLPDSEYKPLILTVTYVIVIFSIIVQGLTIGRLANKVGREPDLM
jgi:CPA1 family monovalent cation:H+ antiporter